MNRAREETSARAASDREEVMAQARSEASLAVQHWVEQQEQRGATVAQSAKKEAKATLEQAMAHGRAEAEAAARTVSETAVRPTCCRTLTAPILDSGWRLASS